MSLAELLSTPRLLLPQLQRIEDLWQKLVYVKWNPRYLVLLDRLSQDLEQAVLSHGHDRLIELAARLKRHVRTCLAAEYIPRRADRDVLSTLLAEMRHALSSDKAVYAQTDAAPTMPGKILVLDTDPDMQWILRLEEAGFQVYHLTALVEPQAALQQINPGMIIVDVNLRGIPLGGTQMIAELRATADLMLPVLFISERDDLEARLEAARAGGIGYFTKPVDGNALVDYLESWLLEQSARHRDRVLIVSEQPAEAAAMIQPLQSRGLTTLLVEQPAQAIRLLHRFQPDLLVLDLELKTMDGPDLARVFSQHPACRMIPLILLSARADQAAHPAPLHLGGAHLLSKPVCGDYLYRNIIQDLQRVRDSRRKLISLTDREATTGLFNRSYFLNHLEDSVTALGMKFRSVAVILIMLDNLQEIRNSTNVRVAEDIVAQAATRLRRTLGNRYPTARFGDAIFTVPMVDTDRSVLLKTARELRDILETDSYRSGEHTEQLHTSTGISITTDAKENYLTLIQQANIASSMAREARGERIYIHHPLSLDQDDEEFQRRRLLETIKRALEQRRCKLMFQPIVSLQEDNIGRYEVLARFYDEKSDELTPATVFGVTQRHPLGVALDRLIITEAMQVLARCQTSGYDILLFIKLLPVTLRDERLPVWLQQQLAAHGVKANRLIFQVPAITAQHDFRYLLDFIKNIKALGCGFTLDRFDGCWDRSIHLLNRIEADYVKLDMHFARDLVANKSKQDQLRKLAQKLRNGGVSMIVGGIEHIRTLPLLWSYEVNYVQGFFLQPPYEKMVYDFSGSL